MDLYEAVHVRKSVRSYSGKPVEDAVKERILWFASHLFSLKEQKVCCRIADRKDLKKHPGLFCPQAPCYLTLYSEVCDGYEENAGYVMQQIALYLCVKGLGCCFLGSVVCADEVEGMVPVVSISFGWPNRKNLYREEEKANRLPLTTLCTMKEETSQEILEVLQGARLAPSSFNSQPWRFVVYQNRVHIFYHCRKALWAKRDGQEIGRLSRIDMGIMLANFLLVSEQLWLETEMVRMENIAEQEVKHNKYFLTVRFL